MFIIILYIYIDRYIYNTIQSQYYDVIIVDRKVIDFLRYCGVEYYRVIVCYLATCFVVCSCDFCV